MEHAISLIHSGYVLEVQGQTETTWLGAEGKVMKVFAGFSLFLRADDGGDRTAPEKDAAGT